MTAIEFETTEAGGKVLYRSTEAVADANLRSTLYYYVFVADGEPEPDGQSFPLADCFDQSKPVSTGAFVFVDGAPTAAELLAELPTHLHHGTNPVTHTRVAWRHSSTSYATIEQSAVQAVTPASELPFGRWIVEVGIGSQIAPNGDDGLAIHKAPSGSNSTLNVLVEINGVKQAQNNSPDDEISVIDVPLAGDHTGAMQFDWQWYHNVLEAQFGGELRTFFGDEAATATRVRYPLFTPPLPPGPQNFPDLLFKVTAHPLAPLTDARTRLALAPDAGDDFNKLDGVLMRTPTGAAVKVEPLATGTTVDGAGFGFAKTTGNDLYLTPSGVFNVVGADTATAANTSGVQVMAGTSGSEFVLTEAGDTITFQNDQAAFAKGFDPTVQGQTPLGNDLTTSWARVHRKNGASAPQGAPETDVAIPTSYCAQPSHATYFARHSNQAPEDFSVAIGISLSRFGPDPLTNEVPLFPFLPYGGVYYVDKVNGILNPNPDVAASTVGAFEDQVIEPRRRAQLEPTFDYKYGPIFFDAANNTAFNGGAVRTPMGFIAELNASDASTPDVPAGSMKRLQIAQSPQPRQPTTSIPDPDQFLEVKPDDNGVVNPTFTNAVLRDNLFMVITDPDLLWKPPAPVRPTDDLGNRIKLGDFTFEVDIGALQADDDTHPRAVCVFKFMQGVSFVDLVKDTDRWTSFFEGETSPTKVTAEAVAKQIQGYLDKAEAASAKAKVAGAKAEPGDENADEGKDLYAAFNQIVNDKSWTGMLVFNCPLDYRELPSDIQILLGGIQGTLRAHHFGVTINRVNDTAAAGTGASGGLAIANSSLFAVIDYEKEFVDPPNDPNFQVLLLKIEYANSKLVIFDSKIAFSNKVLFGNPVQLAVPGKLDRAATDTFVIKGVYTLHEDGTGSLVFATHEVRVFTPRAPLAKRVLQAQSVDNATLVPVSSVEDATTGVVTAIAQFRLDCTLVFKSDIVGDIFSYGEYKKDTTNVPARGLAIVDYAFGMTTTIQATIAPATLAPIRTELDGLKVDQALSASRENSFDNMFPSRIDALPYFESGLTTAQIGAWQVQKEKGVEDVQPDYLEDIAPNYALQFKIPMGSLGGLVSETNNLVADLYVGWIAGSADTTADQVGAVLVLPASIAGSDGFKVQGVARSTFESVQLDRQEFGSLKDPNVVAKPYDLRFETFQTTLLGIPLYWSAKDLGIFGGPTDPGGDNSMWFVGATAKDDDKKFSLSAVLTIEPAVFIGRSFAIETDPADPKVIDDAITSLSTYGNDTVAKFMAKQYATSSTKYSSSAGMAFALKFEFASLALSLLFHDNDFYGAKIKLEFGGDDEEKKEDGEGDGDAGGDDDAGGGGDKKGVNKLKGFEFSIIYRKLSDHLGVWSATIYIDVGEIEIGAGKLTLPDFSISIWTNGDWRFSVGWPIDDHPIGLEFQAGPIPVTAKLGFYLAKMRSADAPNSLAIPNVPADDKPLQCPPNFALIWEFGLGIAAGVGKEWKNPPLSAEASLTLGLTFQGFLGSFKGDINKDGVDYYWVCVSLALVGEVKGKVDFVIISASLSLTVTIKLSVAFETYHQTHLELIAEAEVKASIKIVFVTIHFSFKATLKILDKSYGPSKWPVAELDGPTPKKVANKLRPTPDLTGAGAGAGLAPSLTTHDAPSMATPRGAFAKLAQAVAGASDVIDAVSKAKDRLSGDTAVSAAAADAVEAVTIDVNFLLQSTAISTDGTTFTPVGVATLVVESGAPTKPFGQLANGITSWLVDKFGQAGDFKSQLMNVQHALGAGEFDQRVTECLNDRFVFKVGAITQQKSDNAVVATMPVPAALGVDHDGKKTPFGAPAVPANYEQLVAHYFDPTGSAPTAVAAGAQSVASLVFDEYFRMLAQQLVADLVEWTGKDPANTTQAAGIAAVLDNVAGFVSRFLLSGIRLPKPDSPSELAAMYELTHQQFEIGGVLTASLYAAEPLPSWITLDSGVSAELDSKQLYNEPPTAVPWTVEATPALSAVDARFPMVATSMWSQTAALATKVEEVDTTITLTPDSPTLIATDRVKFGKEEMQVADASKAPTYTVLRGANDSATAAHDKDALGTLMTTLFRFGDALHLGIEGWQHSPEHKDTAGPWLELSEVAAAKDAKQAATSYTGKGALLMPIKIKTIPSNSANPTEVLDNVYSLVGTDEVHRAYLQDLLDSADLTIDSMDLLINVGQGTFESTATPDVLVRTNLSTSTAPSGAGGGAAAHAVDSANADAPDSHCSDYAKPKLKGDEFGRFLRLVWECSIVHTGGFFLQVDDIKPEKFEDGELSLQLLVRTSAKTVGQTIPADTIKAESCHNVLVGPAPSGGSTVVANLNSDAGGTTPVQTYTASYPGGSASWSIKWDIGNPQIDVEHPDSAKTLQLLYQMVSYRVTAIGGVAPESSNWSRPITALHEGPDKASVWKYQDSFPAAPLLGPDENTYAAIGKSAKIDVLLQDLFGNTIALQQQPDLPVVYNDELLGLALWTGTQTNFKVTESTKSDKVQFAVNFSYGSTQFSLGDFTDIDALITKLQGADEVSKYVWGTFTAAEQKILTSKPVTKADVQAELDAIKPQPPTQEQIKETIARAETARKTAVQATLIGGLNNLIAGGVVLNQSAFSGVTLLPQTQQLLAKNPTGMLLTFLNRLLLQNAYPDLIVAAVEDKIDLQTLTGQLTAYSRVKNQLDDGNVSAAINTGNILAPDTPALPSDPDPTGALTGDSVVGGLRAYIDRIVTWLQWRVDSAIAAAAGTTPPPQPDVPEPATLSFELGRDFPLSWDGDLRELRVSLLLRREHVLPDNAELAPLIQHVSSPIAAVSGKSTEADPTGLSAFALGFEKAYYRFDGKDDGVIKVATGVNSDLTSARLGSQSLWLARWGATSGITVNVLDPATTEPVYYAPPPLSTRLITRTVKDLKDYSGGTETSLDKMVFSGIDLDSWARNFLSSVETIFSPQIAPYVADRSTHTPAGASPPSDDDIYTSYVLSKTGLARAIADKLTFIYQGFENSATDGTSDPTSAIETMRQALLNTLENDYGISTLIQMAAEIGLHGEIEPGNNTPPNIYGSIMPTGVASNGHDAEPLPYDFSPAKLPLKAGRAWLNFLLSVQAPETRRALQLPLEYQMGFIEHDIDDAATRCNYTPSDWLTFVLQQNKQPGMEQNTLTAPMGAPRIPIPLRSYPPLPKLLGAEAKQAHGADAITTIEEALLWDFTLNVGRPSAAQDTLNLVLTFNEPPPPPKAKEEPAPRGAPIGRPGDLFDALARYSHEYPQLEPDIMALAENGTGTPNSDKALKDFRDLVSEVANAWPGWTQPGPPLAALIPPTQSGDHEVWTYSIDREPDGSMSCTASWSRDASTGPIWPEIEGYTAPSDTTTGADGLRHGTYVLAAAEPVQLKLSWGSFYILDYQSVHASAYIERNKNLGEGTGHKTNEMFVYRTETVSTPSASVPLIKASNPIEVTTSTDLQPAIQKMFDDMHTKPAGALVSESKAILKLEGPISYKFRLLDNLDTDVSSLLPLFLLILEIPDGGDPAAATQTATNITKWQTTTKPKIDHSSFSFRLTIFATKIVAGDEQLPLVQFQDLSIPVSSTD